ncbi:uncharacterized protein BJ171DRAFT_15187 [Polychytrium aggregatum]|uniref:uncharacterized protein n=1 Tax=Polychytrium aggregatum TaxID=110093 RepID=UPI0022FDB9C9|nr:uncharacterized protein BJ171DRAFT_15187 [Polychytrium aggregatum]KAI9206594.1 hypothetical protein BJ171DRAFT_15187 [Polychytrium aggregatum]
MKQDVQDQVSKFKEVELAKMRLEEKARYQQDAANLRAELERANLEKTQSILKWEEDEKKRVEAREKEVERQNIELRQRLLEESNRVIFTEQKIRNEAEMEARAMKLDYESLNRRYEQAMEHVKDLQEFKERYTLKMQETMAQYKVELNQEHAEQLSSVKIEKTKIEAEWEILKERQKAVDYIMKQVTASQEELDGLRESYKQAKQDLAETAKARDEYIVKCKDLELRVSSFENSTALEFELQSLKKQLLEAELTAQRRQEEYQALLKTFMLPKEDEQKELAKIKKSERKWQRECQQLIVRLDQEMSQNEELQRQLDDEILKGRELRREIASLKLKLHTSEVNSQMPTLLDAPQPRHYLPNPVDLGMFDRLSPKHAHMDLMAESPVPRERRVDPAWGWSQSPGRDHSNHGSPTTAARLHSSIKDDLEQVKRMQAQVEYTHSLFTHQESPVRTHPNDIHDDPACIIGGHSNQGDRPPDISHVVAASQSRRLPDAVVPLPSSNNVTPTLEAGHAGETAALMNASTRHHSSAHVQPNDESTAPTSAEPAKVLRNELGDRELSLKEDKYQGNIGTAIQRCDQAAMTQAESGLLGASTGKPQTPLPAHQQSVAGFQGITAESQSVVDSSLAKNSSISEKNDSEANAHAEEQRKKAELEEALEWERAKLERLRRAEERRQEEERERERVRREKEELERHEQEQKLKREREQAEEREQQIRLEHEAREREEAERLKRIEDDRLNVIQQDPLMQKYMALVQEKREKESTNPRPRTIFDSFEAAGKSSRNPAAEPMSASISSVDFGGGDTEVSAPAFDDATDDSQGW